MLNSARIREELVQLQVTSALSAMLLANTFAVEVLQLRLFVPMEDPHSPKLRVLFIFHYM